MTIGVVSGVCSLHKATVDMHKVSWDVNAPFYMSTVTGFFFKFGALEGICKIFVLI